MAKKYIVDLNKDEKAELVALTQKGRPGARKIKRANLLLLADTGKPDFDIAELLHTSWLTVLRTRHRFVEGGLDFADLGRLDVWRGLVVERRRNIFRCRDCQRIDFWRTAHEHQWCKQSQQRYDHHSQRRPMQPGHFLQITR